MYRRSLPVAERDLVRDRVRDLDLDLDLDRREENFADVPPLRSSSPLPPPPVFGLFDNGDDPDRFRVFFDDFLPLVALDDDLFLVAAAPGLGLADFDLDRDKSAPPFAGVRLLLLLLTRGLRRAAVVVSNDDKSRDRSLLGERLGGVLITLAARLLLELLFVETTAGLRDDKIGGGLVGVRARYDFVDDGGGSGGVRFLKSLVGGGAGDTFD